MSAEGLKYFWEVSAGFGLLAGMLMMRRLFARASRGSGAYPPARQVSVIIPARNEERNLPRLLLSIGRQNLRPGEIIVVDDGSTDRTAEYALAAGARVISLQGPPAGWSGKAWACQQGAAAATGRFLIFLDADVWFPATDSLEMAWRGFDGSAISFLPFHETQKPYESLSAMFNLIVGWVGLSDRRLFGQSLLISREAFTQVGGYESVRKEVLENFFLSDILKTRGIPFRAELGRGILHMRMYPDGARSLCAGWSKAFGRGASGSSVVATLLLSIWMVGIISACELALGGSRVYWPVVAFGLQAYLLFARVGRFGATAALFHPFHVAFFQGLFAVSAWRSLRRQPARWRGRPVPVS